MNFIVTIFLLLFGCANYSPKTLSVSNLFSDGVILQRDTTVAIWGSANPNTLLELESSWGASSETKSDHNGKWNVQIKTEKAGGPHWLKIKSLKEKILIKDILFGEVWIAAGQSNMEMNFDYCCNTTDSSYYEINSANYPSIRMFNVEKNLSYHPTDNLNGAWVSAIGHQIIDFSAAGYFFAKNLHQNLKIPIGIIHSSWGGSKTEAWTSHEVLSNIEEYQDSYKNLKYESSQNMELRDFLFKYNSRPMPSSAWDLFLGEFLREKKPSIGYLNWVLDDWQSFDSLGVEIINGNKEIDTWLIVKSKDTIEKYLNSKDFIGAVLFKNKFKLDDISENIVLKVQPGKDINWGLFEYDIFINGFKIFSTLFNTKSKGYKFNKESKILEINKSLLRKGENQIFIRTIGQPSLCLLSFESKSKGKSIQLENWELGVLGEEFFQINNYKYPYTSLYSYVNKSIDYNKRPKKTYLTHGTFGSIFNGMLNPLIPFTIKGVIWYQGESQISTDDPKFKLYTKLMPLMVEDWRKRWGNNFPFYFAQIAPYYNYQGMLPYFQNIQSKLAAVIPKSKMIVLNDIGENYDIHPSNKHDVGFRFSQLALKYDYGFEIIASGPIFRYAEQAGDKINIFFKSDNLELKIDSTSISSFEIAGNDKNYHNASVKIIENYIEAFSDSVSNPVYVRYAWSDTASATLFNKDGWPASLFTNELY